MSAGQPTVRARLYEDDPLRTFVDLAEEYDDCYELPAALVGAVWAAERARAEAMDAVEAYIRDNNIPKTDPMEEL